MKFTNYQTKLIVTFMLTICCLNNSISQEYGIKFIPLEFSINPFNLWEQNDKLYVSSINNIENIPGSSIIELNYNLDTIATYFYPNIIFGRNGPQLIDNKLYAYCEEVLYDDRSLLVVIDQEFKIVRRDTFYTQAANFNINSMNQLAGEIIGVGIDDNDCEPNCYEMNIKAIDTEGSQLSSFNLDENENYFFSFQTGTTNDNNLLIGGINYTPWAKASLFKVSTDGNVFWNYKSSSKSSRGNIPISALELSNGNIVYTDKLYKIDDDDYLELGFTHEPNQLVWLSSESDSLMSYLDTVSWNSSTEYYGLVEGMGDYFFVHGHYSKGSTVEDPLDGYFGFVMKMSNVGEIIWRRAYHIGGDITNGNFITQMLELENGDLITVGVAATDTSLET